MIDPRDAAIALRTFPRRWREVKDDPDLDPAVLGRLDGLERRAVGALVDAARSAGWAVDGDLAAVSDALADHIDASGPDRWQDDARREALDEGVQAAAAALREAQRLVEAA